MKKTPQDKAIDEIKVIMNKYDLSGFIVMVGEDTTSSRLFMDSSTNVKENGDEMYTFVFEDQHSITNILRVLENIGEGLLRNYHKLGNVYSTIYNDLVVKKPDIDAMPNQNSTVH